MLHLSPILTKGMFSLKINSDYPENIVKCASCFGSDLGLIPYIAFFNYAIYSGVVPQHPPAIFNNPSSANFLILSANISGVSSYPPIAFGSPALG